MGTINDIKSISHKAKSVGALSFIDAVQLAPHVSIDVQDIGCDFLVCSAYKFFGPHQGILWGRKEIMQSLKAYKVRPATSDLPGCFETGTQSHEGMAGTIAAVNYFVWVGREFAKNYYQEDRFSNKRTMFIHSALDYLFKYEKTLTDKLINGLENIDNVKIQGITQKNALNRRLPTVAFTVKDKNPGLIASALGKENIFVWSGHSYAIEVVKNLGLHNSGGVVRVGPVHYNSFEEVEEFLVVLENILPGI